jgi:C4-dicarboxylate-specific signal transduction histidine kinase
MNSTALQFAPCAGSPRGSLETANRAAANEAHAEEQNAALQLAHERIHELNANLERYIAQSTRDLSLKNAQIDAEIAARRRAEDELARTQAQLFQVSRQAATAELVNNVLHNVGNVLVSLNVSASLIADRVGDSKVSQVARVVALLREHKGDLENFLVKDDRGKRIPEFLAQLAEVLHREQEDLLQEVGSLRTNLDRICEIVATQQGSTKLAGNRSVVDPRELVEECLRLGFDQRNGGIEIIRDFSDVPSLVIEKHKVMEILENLLLNAHSACIESGRLDPRLTIRVAHCDRYVSIGVSDNGVGIPPENLPRIFTHGFTTKKDGHGFGLHSGALAARELGGLLRVHSDGRGCGATFTLDLPLAPIAEKDPADPGIPPRASALASALSFSSPTSP